MNPKTSSLDWLHWKGLVATELTRKLEDNLGLITQFGGTVGGLEVVLLKSLQGWDESVLAEDTDLTFQNLPCRLQNHVMKLMLNVTRKRSITGILTGGNGTGGQKDTCNVSLSIHGAF